MAEAQLQQFRSAPVPQPPRPPQPAAAAPPNGYQVAGEALIRMSQVLREREQYQAQMEQYQREMARLADDERRRRADLDRLEASISQLSRQAAHMAERADLARASDPSHPPSAEAPARAVEKTPPSFGVLNPEFQAGYEWAREYRPSFEKCIDRERRDFEAGCIQFLREQLSGP